MKKNLRSYVIALFAACSLFFVTASMAQTSTTGTVEGTVADQTGAVVPNATVTLSGPNLIRAANHHLETSRELTGLTRSPRDAIPSKPPRPAVSGLQTGKRRGQSFEIH